MENNSDGSVTNGSAADNANTAPATAEVPKKRAPRRASTATAAAKAAAAVEPSSAAPAESAADASEAAPKKKAATRSTRTRAVVAEAAATASTSPAEGASADASSADKTVAPAAAEDAPAAPKKRVSRAKKVAAADAESVTSAVSEAPASAAPASASAAPASASAAADEAPAVKRATRATRTSSKTAAAKAAADAPADGGSVDGGSAAASDSAPAAAAAPSDAPADSSTGAPAEEKKATRAKRGRKSAEAAPANETENVPAEGTSVSDSSQAAVAQHSPSDAEQAKVESVRTVSTNPRGPRGSRSRNKNNNSDAKGSDAQSTDSQTLDNSAADSSSSSETAEATPDNNGNANESRQNNRRNRGRNNQTDDAQDDNSRNSRDGNRNNRNNQSNDSADDNSRNSRNRQRDRKRRGGPNDDFEPELNEDDVLLPIAGILDVLDNYAFVRTSGYLPGTNDVYVSLGQVKKYNLRKGDAIVGAIRQPRENDHNGRQKYNAIVKIDSVNGLSVEDNEKRVDFNELTPLYPQERLRLETSSEKITQRIIDLVAPIGKGQRGLIVAPPKAGKTIVMQQIANAIATNNPEVHLMVVLVDERPEEVTDMQRTVKGEVIASTFDRPAEDHTTVAELAIERAKRLVELGHDVVVLLDSITRLGRAYNLTAPASGRVLSGGVDASALYPPKRFFGAARNIENGGSLTILATALVETGSKMDEVIFEEFKGTGNMELRLSRHLADKRIFPAVDVTASSTRREEMLMGADEVKVTWKLRRALSGLDQQQALEVVLGKLKDTSSNVEFLMQMQKSGSISSAKD